MARCRPHPQDFVRLKPDTCRTMMRLQLLLISIALIGSSQAAGTRTTFAGNRLPDIVPGIAGVDYPVASRVPTTLRFRCDQQDYPGFFADVETGCQVFHVCRDNRKTSFLCPNGTLYHQRFFVCDWWFNVDCSKSVGLYPLNKDAMQRHEPSPQDGRAEASQPQAAAVRSSSPYFQEPTPTPSFARFDKREIAEPTFHEWASRHIPLSNPADTANFKTTRSAAARSRAADVTVPFFEPPFKSLSSTLGPQVSEFRNSLLSAETRNRERTPWAPSITSSSFTTNRPDISSDYNHGHAKNDGEYPVSSFPSSTLPDKWLLLAKDPDFLNNIAWGAQLHIINKTRGTGYLRNKPNNRRPISEQELDIHPFQGFRSNPADQSPSDDRSSIRAQEPSVQEHRVREPSVREPQRQPEKRRQSEPPRPPFVPSPLLSQSKEQQRDEKSGTYWKPSSIPSYTNALVPSSTTSRPFQQTVTSYTVQYSSPPIRPVQQKTTYPTPTKPTPTIRPPAKPAATSYSTAQRQQTSSPPSYRVTAGQTVYIKKPWITTPAGQKPQQQQQQLKKQQYYKTTGSNVGAASSPNPSYLTPAYQVVLTGGSDYQVTNLQTRATPLASSRPPAPTTRAQPVQAATLRSQPQLRPQRLIPQSILLPLEPHPSTSNQQLIFNNQRNQQQPLRQQPTARPAQQRQQLQTQASTPVRQNSRSDATQHPLFRPSELEKMSIPIRPSLLLSTTGPSSRSPFEFEPTHREWSTPAQLPAPSPTSNYTPTSTKDNNNLDTFPLTPFQRQDDHITNIIRGRLVPANVFPTEPTNYQASSSDNDQVRSFVVRPRNPITMASSL